MLKAKKNSANVVNISNNNFMERYIFFIIVNNSDNIYSYANHVIYNR